MRRVERALRDDQPRAALALLDALDRDIPNGSLVEERAAAEVMARCALGHADSAQLERSFADRYPRSVYLSRVRRRCSGDRRNQSAPDTYE